MVNGQLQRKALTAAEQAIRALGAGDAARARMAAGRAAELDQIGVFTAFHDAVAEAATAIERDGDVGAESWAAVRSAVSPGPLEALVDEASS